MPNRLQKLIKKLGHKYQETNAATILVHIGKCGGSTIESELKAHQFRFFTKHIRPVTYYPEKKFILTIRNPKERFVSAFNWRYKLVVKDQVQATRFKGEKALLEKYQNANQLAESLYDKDNKLVIDLSKTPFYIHHLKEDIHFYLGNFLKECPKENILAVITTEFLQEDMMQYFNIQIQRHEKNNKHHQNGTLSDLAVKNLKKYLKKDYKCIEQLYDMNLISQKKYLILSQ